MKKIVLLLITLSLITSCENEPLDPDLTQQGNGNGNGNGNGGSESDDLTLSVYELDTKVNVVFFGIPIESITNSSLNITNNTIAGGTNALSANDSPFENENFTISYNASGQVVSNVSINTDGVTTNETIITYTDGKISRITYDFYIDEDDDDYDYSFTYNDNTITRTEVGTSITTVFTLDGFDRVIRKESFDNGFSIQNESVVYNGLGNISSSITTGETQTNNTYTFDDNTNPLKVIYESNYLLNFLQDEYEDEIGGQIAQFLSTNNWNGATFNGVDYNFDLEYNSTGRITSRDIAYDFGPDLSFEFNERFNYVN